MTDEELRPWILGAALIALAVGAGVALVQWPRLWLLWRGVQAGALVGLVFTCWERKKP